MKRLSYLIIICACALFCACESDKDLSLNSCVITETQVTALGSNEAEISFKLEFPSVSGNGNNTQSPDIKKYGVFYSASSNIPTSNDEVIILENTSDYKWSFSVPISNLKEKTHYYARPFVRDALGSQVTGEVIEFTTLNDKVTMNFTSITEVTASSAQLNGTIKFGEDAIGKVTEIGYVYSDTYSMPDVSNSNKLHASAPTAAGSYSMNWSVEELNGSTKYYVRMYYKMGSSAYYSSTKNFTTLTPDDAIILNFTGITDVTANSAMLNGTITLGADAVGVPTECGYLFTDAYSVPSPTNSSVICTGDILHEAGEHQMNWQINNLNSQSKYYVRMYYKIGSDYYYYPDIKTFTTSDDPNNPLNDILGTYSMTAISGNYVNWDSKTSVSWYNIRIAPYPAYGNIGVKIVGLYEGDANYVAFGTYDKSSKTLTLRKTTNETVPTFLYYSSERSRYYNCQAMFQPIEWAYCGDCGVWSGMTIPYSSTEFGDFVLTSTGRLEQGKSTVETDETWYIRFNLETSETDSYIGYIPDIHDVVLTRTSTNY